MSSPYPVLYNRPIDQWKVTELKEELRKRKLMTKGLKEDLVKRLDEAICNERESVNEELGNGFGLDSESEVKSEDSKPEPIGSQVVEEAPGYVVNEGEKVDNVDVAAATVDIGGNNASAEAAQEDQVQDGKSMDGTDKNSKVDETVIHTVSMENSVIDVQSVETKLESSAQVTKCNIQVENEDSKPPSFEDVKPNISDSNNQVSEVSPILGFQVKCESISTDSVSINEKNELKDNLNADNLNLELEVVKPEMVEPSSRDVPAIGGDLHSLGDQEPGENQGSMEERHDTNAATADLIKKNESTDAGSPEKLNLDTNAATADLIKKNESTDAGSPEKLNLDRSLGDDSLEEDAADLIKKNESTDAGSPEKLNLDTNAPTADLIKKNESTDAGSPEKLNLDRSSGDDSLEEDVLDSKQIDSNHNSDEAIDRNEPMELPVVKEGSADVAMEVGPSPGKRVPDEKNDNLEISSEKRKLEDQELVGNSEPSKRQRRWNTETIKVPEPQTTNLTPSGTPKDAFQYTPRRAFTRSDSTLSGDSPKERIVPISQKTPTTSLRIDRFLRPFTLKAVQELLAKTGTVTDFWMDHIKTHCYVTYSSGEEAIATRKALYNLQWPPNGGRLLTADFVDPQEVKTRVEAPPQSPAPVSPSPTAPAPTSQPQPASHQHTIRQQLPPPPPLPAPPPPPLSDPLPVRERLSLPPPPPKKPDPPIVTLDDLFRKTRATPRIYYLPLSEEQVAAKLTAQARSRKD